MLFMAWRLFWLVIDAVGEAGDVGELVNALLATAFFGFTLLVVGVDDDTLVVRLLMAFTRVVESFEQFPVGP